jgi:hypothetical protein
MSQYEGSRSVYKVSRFLDYRFVDGTSPRRSVDFTLLSLESHFLRALKTMGDEFLSGYILLSGCEKDPRNLLLVFAITRVVLVEFNISNHVEVPRFLPK